VIVSGTLEPLAKAAARALEAELASRGFAVRIRVCATQLEEGLGRWTGRIAGEAMFREAKARAVKRLAQEMHLDLAQCWAYGDSVNDRWMLADIGKPVAVNPSRQLARIARKRGWPVLRWNQARSQTQRHREHGEKEGQEQPREIQERSLQAVRWI
jgi:phosphoserine phosphatase